MKYFIFDMDETIAHLYSVFYFIASIKIKELSNEVILSRILENKLKIAYKVFVNKITKEENSDLPLGIIRPGIIDIMYNLKELQSKGIINKVAIYSNNSHLESLQLIRDIIHTSIGSDSLIGDCIHWNHPLRDEERFLHEGATNKTWPILKNILINGPCGAPNTIQPTDVYFFDDLRHEKMFETLYFQVPPYTTKASFNRIRDIYIDALIAANLTNNEKQEFYTVVSNILLGINQPYNTLNTIILSFLRRTKCTIGPYVKLTKESDNGIMIMKSVIDILSLRSGVKDLKVEEGGYKKTRRARHRKFNKSKRIKKQ